MPSDGIVLVGQYRLKESTVDLMYSDEKMYSLDNGVVVPMADSSSNIERNTIYKMNAVMCEKSRQSQIGEDEAEDAQEGVQLHGGGQEGDCERDQRPDPRLDPDGHNKHVIPHAQEDVHQGSGGDSLEQEGDRYLRDRQNEWKEMMVEDFSYIAVDPNNDMSTLFGYVSLLRARRALYELDNSRRVRSPSARHILSAISKDPPPTSTKVKGRRGPWQNRC